MYMDRIKTRIVLKMKATYKLELLTPEAMNMLGSTEKGANKDKDGEILPKLESFTVVLVHFNLVKNDYQKTSKVLFTFAPNKQFGQVINSLKR